MIDERSALQGPATPSSGAGTGTTTPMPASSASTTTGPTTATTTSASADPRKHGPDAGMPGEGSSLGRALRGAEAFAPKARRARAQPGTAAGPAGAAAEHGAEITLRSTFAEVLGAREALPRVKRQRWAHWLRLARNAGHGSLAADWATDIERCQDCRHRRGGWCESAALPCSVNPILTFRMALPGMACMGAGFEPKQLNLSI